MSNVLNDTSYDLTQDGVKKPVRMRTIQLPIPKEHTEYMNITRVLSMLDHPHNRVQPHQAKLTHVSLDHNGSNTYNIDEIREVLAEWDAWQGETEPINVDYINACITRLTEAGYYMHPSGNTYCLISKEEGMKVYLPEAKK